MLREEGFTKKGAGQAGHTLTPATPTHARKYTLRGTATRPQATKIDAATVATALSWLVVDVCGRVDACTSDEENNDLKYNVHVFLSVPPSYLLISHWQRVEM